MGTETKKEAATGKEFKPFLTAQDVKAALEQRHVDLLSENLNSLRKQLHAAIGGGIDPTEKFTRPLIEYLQSSQEGDELFAVWELQNQNNIQAIETSILDVIKLFLDLCHAPVIRSSGVALIRRILQQLLRYVYRSLTTARIMLQQSTLRLLVSMNSFSAATTREILDTFNFQLNGFTNFCNYRRKDNNNANSWKYDLRTSYVDFVLSFFKFGDASVKKDILQVKDLVSPIFKGLERDAYPLIETILSVMYEHFIMDQEVPRTTKVVLFNNYILDQLARVYARQTADATSPTETDIPANLVHHFLISICCTPGVGVCFHDAGWYPPSILDGNKKNAGDGIKIRNKILGHFIKGLRVSEDLRQQELLVKILKACPELAQGYWQSTSLTFEPRLSSNWLANIAILQKVLVFPPPSLLLGKMQIYPTTPPSHLVIADNILPSCISRAALSKGLQHNSGLVRYMTILTLTASMKKLSLVTANINKVVATFQDNDFGNASTTQAEKIQQERKSAILNWKGCLRKVCDELCRRLPGVQLLATLYSSATTATKPDSLDGGVETPDEKNLIQDSILRLIMLLQQCLPEVMIEAKFDFSNFMPSDLSAVKATAQMHLLELLLTLNDFRWSNKPAGSSKSHLHGLLTLLLSTPNKHVEALTRKLLVKTLSDTFMFNHDPQEIELWLDSLPTQTSSNNPNNNKGRQLSEQQDMVLSYLDDCISRFMKAQYKYMDASLEIVKKTNSAAMDVDSPEGDTEQKDAQSVAQPSTFSDSQPFSPLLITVMEQFGYAKDGKEHVARLIHKLFAQLTGKQLQAGYLLSAFNQYLAKHIETNLQTIDFRSATRWDSHMVLASTLIILERSSIVAEETTISALNSYPPPAIDSKDGDIQRMEQTFLQMLQDLPVDAFHQHLGTLCQFCEGSLGWEHHAPLVDYMEERHPAAGSVFQYCNLYGGFDALDKLAKEISFETLFQNIDIENVSSPTVCSLLKKSIANLDRHHLISAARSVLLLLTNCQKSSKDVYGCIKLCLSLLDSILTHAQNNADQTVVNSVAQTIFKHPVLLDWFLDLSNETDSSNISDDIQAMVVQHLISLEKEGNKKAFDAKELHLPYIIQVLNYTLEVLHECQTDTSSNDKLNDTLVQRIFLFRDLLGKDDLISIVRALLSLYHSKARNKAFENIAYQHEFSSLLTVAAVELCNRLDDLSSFEDELLPALFDMWQTHPTKELDHLIADILEWTSIPAYEENSTIGPAVFANYERRVYIRKPTFVDATAVKTMLDSINIDRARIISTLLKYRQDCRVIFAEYLAGCDTWSSFEIDQIGQMVQSFLLGSQAAQLSQQSSPDSSDMVKTTVARFLEVFQEILLQQIFSAKLQSHQSSQASNLLCEVAHLQLIDDLLSHFLNWCAKPDSSVLNTDVVRVFTTLFTLFQNKEDKAMFAGSFLNAFLYSLLRLVKTRTVLDNTNITYMLQQIMLKLGEVNCQLLSNVNADILQEYVLAVILDELDNPSLINFTSILINLTQAQYSKDEPISTYLRNVLEHSDFKKLTANRTDSVQSEEANQRNAVIWLVYTIVQIRPTAISRHLSLLDPLLCSYGATTQESDQLILSVLHTCEEHAKQSIAGKAILWGPGSDKTRQYHVERGLMFNNSALANAAMSLLDPIVMTNTCSNFPTDLALERDFDHWQSVLEPKPAIETIVYDPAFIMPMLSNMLLSGAIDCRKFLECNAVGMMLVSLSSNVNDVRKVGYMLLDDFYAMLQHAQFREQKQIMLLMNAVKNAIPERTSDNVFKRIPYIITAFAAQSLSILLSPAHFMYPRVNTFILQRPLIDIEDIPLFYKLFNTSSESHKKDRAWILRLLATSLHTFEDHRIYKRRHVYDLITAFFDSKLADTTSQRLVLDVIWMATDSSQITIDLVRNGSLLSWLHQLAASSASNNDEIHTLCSKLLLRIMRSAQVGAGGKRWLTGVPQNHIGTIATTLLKSGLAEEPSDLESSIGNARKTVLVLQVLHGIAMKFDENYLHTQLIQQILSHLRACEEYLKEGTAPSHLQRVELIRLANYDTDIRYSNMMPTDQAALYSLYQLAVYYMMELQIHRIHRSNLSTSKEDKEAFRFIAARTIALGFGDQVTNWMLACINSLP